MPVCRCNVKINLFKCIVFANRLQVIDDIKHLLIETIIFRAPRSTNHSAKSNQSDLSPGKKNTRFVILKYRSVSRKTK